MSGLDKVLISDVMGGFVSEAPPTPFVTYCVACNVFLTQDEMVYKKGLVFHKDCFEKHGKDFPDLNHDLNSLNSNAKVQLVQLKNLKIRQSGGLNKKRSASKSKTKRKSKKKRPKRKTVKKRRSFSKRKKTKQSRKKRSSGKKRTTSKKRKKSKRTSRKTSRPRRRPSRRRTKKKTRRRR